jgi:hypothetical protein
VQAGYCSAIAPAGWQPTATDPKGTILELSNGAFSAFYFIMGVDAMSQQGIPGMGHPAMLVQSTVAGGFRGDPFQRISQPTPFGDLFVQEFESAQFHAVALFRAYPMPMGRSVVLMRIASGPRELWTRYGAGYYKPRAGGGYVKLEAGLGQ